VADELEIRPPGPRLRREADRYYGYSVTRGGPGRERQPISTGVVLIFGLGPELRLVEPNRPRTHLGSFVAGLDDTCAVVEHDGEMRGLQVDLSPLAARRIFRVPMHELSRRVVTLEDALGREATLLEERLAEAGNSSERFELVEAALARRLETAEAAARRRLGLATSEERPRTDPCVRAGRRALLQPQAPRSALSRARRTPAKAGRPHAPLPRDDRANARSARQVSRRGGRRLRVL
jgi:hypothetical protein